MINVLRQFAHDERLLKFLDGLLERDALRAQVHGIALALDSLGHYLVQLRLARNFDSPFWPLDLGASLSRCFALMDPAYAAEEFSRALISRDLRMSAWAQHCKLQGYPGDASPILIKRGFSE